MTADPPSQAVREAKARLVDADQAYRRELMRLYGVKAWAPASGTDPNRNETLRRAGARVIEAQRALQAQIDAGNAAKQQESDMPLDEDYFCLFHRDGWGVRKLKGCNVFEIESDGCLVGRLTGSEATKFEIGFHEVVHLGGDAVASYLSRCRGTGLLTPAALPATASMPDRPRPRVLLACAQAYKITLWVDHDDHEFELRTPLETSRFSDITAALMAFRKAFDAWFYDTDRQS